MVEEIKPKEEHPERKGKRLSELPDSTMLVCEWSPDAPERCHNAAELKECLADGYHEQYKKLKFFIAKKKEIKVGKDDIYDFIENIVDQNDGYEDMAFEVSDALGEIGHETICQILNKAFETHPVYTPESEDEEPIILD